MTPVADRRAPSTTAPVRLAVAEPRRLLVADGTEHRSRTDRPRSVRPASLRARLFRPGWPLAWLLVATPVWWVLGLSTLIFILAAVPMLVHLRRLPRIALPPGFWLWGLFLAWQVLGLVLLGVSPPGTHPGSLSGRLLSVAFSAVAYAAVTVVLLYVGNLGLRTVTQARIGTWLGWFFLSVCAGGLLGTLAPSLSFRSALEFVLPHGISANAFTHSLVHPVAAQVQDVIGTANGRPAAPFGYTNTWGNAVSILLVWFVAAWVVPARGARRIVYALIVAITAVPIAYSLNRGLWVGIGLSVVWLAGRQLWRGNLGFVLGAVAASLAGLAAIALSPLGTRVSSRLTHGVSDNIRQFVAQLSLVAIRHSPVIGYGGSRRANGSSGSIAIGSSPSCSNCGDVPTGSTGQLWSVLFNNGLVGALLYFGFFAFILWRYRHLRGAINEAALLTIALGFVYMLFYSTLPVAPALTMIAVAVLWRAETATQRQACVSAGALSRT